mgnify:CR=1 FL=1
MTIRVFSAGTPAPVEKFNTVNGTGYIVRWDLEPIKTKVPKDENMNRKRRRGAKQVTAPAEESAEEMQEVDTGMTAYSEMRYFGIPDPEKVVADIEADLELRYGENPRPEIDFEAYRSAIAALS